MNNKLSTEGTTDNVDQPARLSELTRRIFLGSLGAGAIGLPAFLAACSNGEPAKQTSSGGASSTGGKRLRAAFSNAALSSTWCAQGKQVVETWGKWFGVDITWYDGGGSVDVQRRVIDDMATKKWDFVAIQTVGIDTLVAPVSQMIDNGIPVIQMDTEIDSSHKLGITTFFEPDNIYMGEVSAEALFQKMGGKGKVIMTQGALGHTGAQRRAKGFRQALAKYPNIELIAQDPADWDVNKVAQLWENYLVKYKQLDGAFFHNDDMALAAFKVVKNANRTIPLAGVDAMPPAIQAVINGDMVATVRNPAGRIHWGALMVGMLAASGTKDIPKYILADGPVVNNQNGPGLIFMENQFFL